MSASDITFDQYVNGTETERLYVERALGWYGAELHEHRRVYQPWDDETARRESATARALMRGDEWHRSGRCKRGRSWERQSCGTCALHGYEPRGGWGDGYSVKRDGPNYAGWTRVYVQSGTPIPAQWRDPFAATVHDDNRAYADALGRDLVTFGHPGYTD